MNVEQPTYGKHQIFLMSMNASMNPYKEHADATKEGWKMNVKDAGKGNLVPAEEQALEGCAHLDHCAGWAGNGRKAGWATFRLPRMDVGRIIVCSPSGKQGAQDFVDGKVRSAYRGLLSVCLSVCHCCASPATFLARARCSPPAYAATRSLFSSPRPRVAGPLRF
jgi:hypothetical protein